MKFRSITTAIILVCGTVLIGLPTLAVAGAITGGFDKRVDNPDGTTTLLMPYYYDDSRGKAYPVTFEHSEKWPAAKNADNQDLVNSGKGICERLEFGAYVASEITQKFRSSTLPILNKDGSLSRFQDDSDIVFKAVVCINPKASAAPSTQYESKIVNGNSVTIVNPRFDFDGESKEISFTDSDIHGVCQLFGYKTATDFELHTTFFSHTFPVIGYSGKLSRLRHDSDRVIERLTCK